MAIRIPRAADALRLLSLLAVLAVPAWTGAARAEDTVDYGDVRPRQRCHYSNVCTQWVTRRSHHGGTQRVCLRYQMRRICPTIIH